MRASDPRVRGDLRERGEGADPQRAVGLDRDPVEAGDALDVDDARRLDEVLLQVVEEVDAAGLEDGAGLLGEELPRLGGRGGPGELEAVHG